MHKITQILLQEIKKMKSTDEIKKILVIIFGAAVLSFGLYNVHEQAAITEGGVLGAILLIHHWFKISPALISLVLDSLCYAMGVKALGWSFLKYSLIATLSFSTFHRLYERFLTPVFVNIAEMPILAAVIGGLFVGVGVGLIVRQKAAAGGDDALALVISTQSGIPISRAYLLTDITVLTLSLSYIPLFNIACSLITVTISSFLIEQIQNLGR